MQSVYVVARRLVELLQRCRVLTEDLNGAQPRQGAEYAATWARVSAYHQTLPLAPCGRAVLRSASISRECKYSELVRGPAFLGHYGQPTIYGQRGVVLRPNTGGWGRTARLLRVP